MRPGEAMNDRAKYRVGDYLAIYCGESEGCCFTVKNVRRAPASHWHPERWEYDAGMYGWRPENTISTEAFARLHP